MLHSKTVVLNRGTRPPEGHH